MNWPLFQNSLMVAAGATVLSVGLGLAVAFCLLVVGGVRRWVMMACAVVAFALPPFLPANCWLDLLGPNGRWISWLPFPIMSLPGTIWLLTLMHWPVTSGFVWSAWRRLEQETLEIDPLLRGVALWRWILWPMARGAVSAATATTFVLALNQFTVPALLQVKVFPAELWISFNTTFDYATAWRIGWPMIVVAMVVLGWLSFGQKSPSPRWSGRAVTPDVFRSRIPSAWRWTAGGCAWIAIGFSVLLPLGHLLLAPLTWKEFTPALQAGQGALGWSVGLAMTTAAVVVGIRLLLSRWRPFDRVLDVVQPLAWMPFLIPGVVLGIGLIWTMNRPLVGWFYDSVGIVVLAWTLRYAAPGWLMVGAGLKQADPRMTDLVRSEGGSGWAVFRFAVWPQARSAAAVAALVVFLFCLWDVEALVLVVPPGVETLALRIFNLLHYGHNSQVNALCLVLLVIALLPLALLAVGRAAFGRKEAA